MPDPQMPTRCATRHSRSVGNPNIRERGTVVNAGATIALYATGLSSGDAVHVRIGGAEAVSVTAQRVFAGVWEVSAKVPAASGNLAVQLSVNGVLSNELRLPVA